MSASVTTSVEVAVTPDAAFDVFTRDIDAWYRVDRDTLPDITRTAAIRFEPHLGGRLLDVHDIATGAGRELGRVTAWEPARRLAFVDNEGTEVEVSFEAAGAGTRVTLTHRGLDRLAPQRARELRRSGWAALTPFYRDHLAPNARPVAVAVVYWTLGSAIVLLWFWLVAMLAGARPSGWASAGVILATVLAGAALVAVDWAQDRLVRGWLPSRWQYEQVLWRLFWLVCLGILIAGLYRAIWHEGSLTTVLVAVVLLTFFWYRKQQGPAGGRSFRQRAASARSRFAERRSFVSKLLLASALVSLPTALSIAMGVQLPQLAVWALLLLWAVVNVLSGLSKRRAKQNLGFDPDLYLAVARQVSEENRRPELLVHRPSKQPEYSGWYAYASQQDYRARELVTWTMKDLVDHSPEAARPLREGRGHWIWDQAQRAYRPMEPSSAGAQPA